MICVSKCLYLLLCRKSLSLSLPFSHTLPVPICVRIAVCIYLSIYPSHSVWDCCNMSSHTRDDDDANNNSSNISSNNNHSNGNNNNNNNNNNNDSPIKRNHKLVSWFSQVSFICLWHYLLLHNNWFHRKRIFHIYLHTQNNLHALRNRHEQCKMSQFSLYRMRNQIKMPILLIHTRTHKHTCTHPHTHWRSAHTIQPLLSLCSSCCYDLATSIISIIISTTFIIVRFLIAFVIVLVIAVNLIWGQSTVAPL